MHKMGDEETIKNRLLIDGDGTGEDRRINTLFKQFLRWTYSKNDSPENNQVIYDRLMAQLAQCEFTAVKNEIALKTIETEKKRYDEINVQTALELEKKKQEIAKLKKELEKAKKYRADQIKCGLMMKLIHEQPDRQETLDKIDNVKKKMDDLKTKEDKLDAKFLKRQNQFLLVWHGLRELQKELEQSDSDVSDVELPDDVAIIKEKEKDRSKVKDKEKSKSKDADHVTDVVEEDDKPSTSKSATRKRSKKSKDKEKDKRKETIVKLEDKEILKIDDDDVLDLTEKMDLT